MLRQRSKKEATAEQALALANKEYSRCKNLLEDTRQRLDLTCQGSLEGSRLDLFEAAHLSYYRESLSEKINCQEKVVGQAGLLVENRRSEAVQARQERQVVEKLREVHLQAFRRQEAAREQNETDELALYAYLKRGRK